MEKIKLVVETLSNLKLENIIVYDMRERSPFFDYFVLSTAGNIRQMQAVTRHLKDNLSAAKFEHPVVEGGESNAWVLMDTKDIVINVFTKEERLFYNLEKMLMDVPTIDVGIT